MIFQDFQLFPHLTALQNIMEAPRSVLRLPKADGPGPRPCGCLPASAWPTAPHAYPAELSGGQKQRVAIARAMAMEPRGLLCDEITSALDPELKSEVLVVLEDLKRDGLTLILVTHEIGFARRAADRVVVLADGKIIEDGPPQQVLDNPQAAADAAVLETDDDMIVTQSTSPAPGYTCRSAAADKVAPAPLRPAFQGMSNSPLVTGTASSQVMSFASPCSNCSRSPQRNGRAR